MTKPRVASGAVGLVVLAAVVVNGATDLGSALNTTSYLGVLVGASVGAWIGAERVTRRPANGATSHRGRRHPDGAG